MEHNKVIEIIKYYYEADPADEYLDPNNLDTAVINCDLYVRPGTTRNMFMAELGVILRYGATSNLVDCQEAVVNLIKRYFDYDFFKLHIKEQKDFSSKKMLNFYLERFSREQLQAFMLLILKARHEGDLFVSNNSSTNLWKKLDEKCMALDNGAPDMRHAEYGKSVKSDPFYQFKCLSKKTIARVFCEHIDKNVKLAEKAAQAFYVSGGEAAVRLVNFELSRCQV